MNQMETLIDHLFHHRHQDIVVSPQYNIGWSVTSHKHETLDIVMSYLLIVLVCAN